MNTTVQQTVDQLKHAGIQFELAEHPAVFTMEEMEAQHLPHTAQIAKNLFLRDDKHRSYYLLSVKGDRHIDLKQLRAILSSRPLSFASEEDLNHMLKLQKGSVTPLGMLNDTEHRVSFLLDDSFKGQLIGVHPNDNTATVYLQADDLIDLLVNHGCSCTYIDLKTPFHA
jgi:Ala-tRNA(Pro) deacylase